MKLLSIILIAVCAFALAACNQMRSNASPTEVFKAQTAAQKKKDVATLKQNLSKGSLEMIEKAAKSQNLTVDEALVKENPAASQPESFELRNEKIDGDTATIEVKVPQSEEWATMPFVKEDGRWKLAMDKFMAEVIKKMQDAQSIEETESNK